MSAAPSPTPLPLAYDDLPPGSDVRREYLDGGAGVKIVVPAGDPPPAATRQALRDAFASAAAISVPLLLLALVLFLIGVRNNRIGGVYLAWAWGFFAVFCSALMLLVAWLRYGMMLDALRAGRQQMTVLAATPERVLIETSGPFGVAGYDLRREKVAAVAIARATLLDDRNTPRRLSHLTIALADGRRIALLPGRDERELRWVRSTLRRTLNLVADDSARARW